MKARSTRMSSTTPSIPTPGMPSVKPTARAPSTTSASRTSSSVSGVGDVVDARPLHALVDAALVGGVLGHRGVPVEVVLGDVEDRGGLRAHRVGVVQLEAGELHGQHVVGRGVHHGLEHRHPDVADGLAAQPGGAQDRVEHLHGGGLAVGAGDGQPRRVVLGVAQPPGQLDLAPHRDAARAGLGEQRRARAPAGRGDDEVDVVGQGGGGAGPEAHRGTEHLEELGALLAIGVAAATRRARSPRRRGG